MAGAATYAAIRARLNANWTTTPIRYPNESFTVPVDNSSFLTVEFPVALSEQITIGAPGHNVFRDTGTLRLVLAVPVGKGVDAGLTQLDTLRALFRGVAFNGITCFAPSPAALNGPDESGAYWLLSSTVEFYADLFA